MYYYRRLTERLEELKSSYEIILTYDEILALVEKLPEESEYRDWWNNEGRTPQSYSWCSAGYDVVKVIPYKYVCFRKNSNRQQLEKCINESDGSSETEELRNISINGIVNSHKSLEECRKEIDEYWTPGKTRNDVNNKIEYVDDEYIKNLKRNSNTETDNSRKTVTILLFIFNIIIGGFLFYHFKDGSDTLCTVIVVVTGFIGFVCVFTLLKDSSKKKFSGTKTRILSSSNGIDLTANAIKNHTRAIEQMMLDSEIRQSQRDMYQMTHEAENSKKHW